MTKKYSRFPDQDRPDGGWLYGQLTKAEVEFFCKLAKGRPVPLVLTGSLAETDLGLRRRYTSILQGFLAKFRRQKPESDMIDTAMKGQVPVCFYAARTACRAEDLNPEAYGVFLRRHARRRSMLLGRCQRANGSGGSSTQ